MSDPLGYYAGATDADLIRAAWPCDTPGCPRVTVSCLAVCCETCPATHTAECDEIDAVRVGTFSSGGSYAL